MKRIKKMSERISDWYYDLDRYSRFWIDMFTTLAVTIGPVILIAWILCFFGGEEWVHIWRIEVENLLASW